MGMHAEEMGLANASRLAIKSEVYNIMVDSGVLYAGDYPDVISCGPVDKTKFLTAFCNAYDLYEGVSDYFFNNGDLCIDDVVDFVRGPLG